MFSGDSNADVKHEHIHYHFQAGEKKYPGTQVNTPAKPTYPSHAVVNYLDVEHDSGSSSSYPDQTFQDRRGSYTNNNPAASSPSLVYSKVVKIEENSPYTHPDFIYRHNDDIPKIGKSTVEGIEITDETNNTSARSKDKFYFPITPKREDGKVETDLVTQSNRGKFVFIDTFPFFRRVARIDDTTKRNDQFSKDEMVTKEHSMEDDNNTRKAVKHTDKNSRRML